MAIRKAGNGIQDWYGALTITAPPLSAALGLNGAAGQTAVLITGTDIAAAIFNSSSAANRDIVVLQQAGAAVARFGADGTNFFLTDSANGDLCFTSVGKAIRFGQGAAATQVAISTAGNVTIAAPTSGTTLTITTAGAAGGLIINGTGAGPTTLALTGVAASQLNAISIQQTGQSQWFFYSPAGSNDLRLFTGTDRVTFAATGNVTVAAPSSGQTITATSGADLSGILINGAQNNVSLTINNTQTGGSANWRITSAATGSGFTAGSLVIGTASSNFATIFSTGGMNVGAPTGGDKGAGTINATGLFVNGVAVGTGAVTSVTGTANQVSASPTTGAVVVSLPGIIALTSASSISSYLTYAPNGGSATVTIGASGAASGIVSGDAVGDLGIKTTGAINIAVNGSSANVWSFTTSGSLVASGLTSAANGTINANQVSVGGVPLYRTGTFTGTITGCTAVITGTVSYVIAGNTATLFFPAAFSGTSNSTSMTMTGLPVVLQPSTLDPFLTMNVFDNGNNIVGAAGVAHASGTVTFYRDILATGVLSTTGFTASGTKGLNTGSITYLLL